jgi:hypothetical protein
MSYRVPSPPPLPPRRWTIAPREWRSIGAMATLGAALAWWVSVALQWATGVGHGTRLAMFVGGCVAWWSTVMLKRVPR